LLSQFRLASYALPLAGIEDSPLINAFDQSLASIAPAHAESRWQRAFSGLTPKVIAIVVALLVLRSAGTMAEKVLVAASEGALDMWLRDGLRGFVTTAIQVAPVLIAVIATANLGPRQGTKRVAALGVAVIVSAGIGSVLRATYVGAWTWPFDELAGMMLYIWSRYALLGGLLTAVGEFYRREAASTQAAQQAEIDRVAFEREMTEARLQVLQAQVEPHFLFNTLANVRRLYSEDSRAGRAMLESFMRYLEVALPQMRKDEAMLERECELIEAYLEIQRIRMGPRLTYAIDIDTEVRTHPVPPMMLLTLVENSVKHGLAPSPNGGLIRVTARASNDRLVIAVADTGVGFGSSSGAGIGLANVSSRLAEQFGDQASLALENNDLGGATATIILPLARTRTP
jgi:sensor histidine kinase YesM